jgi:magnesium chelatase family protein
MYASLYSASVFGIGAFPVHIETHLENAVPMFLMVGLPDSAVKESRERVSAAIKNSELPFPLKRITVNLAPADIRKEGSGFDLPIALGIITAMGHLDQEALDDTVFIGELALDGELRPIHGALSIALMAKEQGIKRIVMPKDNAEEAGLVEAVEIIPISSLQEAISFLRNEVAIPPHQSSIEGLFEQVHSLGIDFGDIKGQEQVKRAFEVSASGGHNLILVGPPGSGKTMIAKRLPGILPPMTMEEALETTKIHSVAGQLPKGIPLVTMRPFRSPHHTISDAALVGGGMGVVKAGEISLAHHGVLFLDELPEFARNVLEVLRQPLEDRSISISRTKMSVEYPANFMLICSMNPCPCGHFGNPHQQCTCTTQQIQRYMGRISGPLLDRIDIHVDVPAVRYRDLSDARRGESSQLVRERVIKAREKQRTRFSERKDLFKNADMLAADIRMWCALDSPSSDLLNKAMNSLGLSARAYDRILKVSRTIADLADSEQIKIEHVSEAVQYRSLDRQFWNG